MPDNRSSRSSQNCYRIGKDGEAEQAGAGGDEAWLAGLVVEVDLAVLPILSPHVVTTLPPLRLAGCSRQ
jgi:hypothetical protein